MPNIVPNTFYSDMYKYAKISSSLTGISPEVILGQWALESNYGQSDLAKRGNNFAGIKSSSKGKHFTTGAYAGYFTKTAFAKDYARVMSLSYYDKVRSAPTIQEQVIELDRSPWAEDTDYARKINAKLKELTGMDFSSVSGVVTDGEGKINFVGWALGLFGVWWLLFR
jgi:flagellum-specific peptidoglycan hydrolase FlgJ